MPTRLAAGTERFPPKTNFTACASMPSKGMRERREFSGLLGTEYTVCQLSIAITDLQVELLSGMFPLNVDRVQA